jgi:tRNA-splicing ligase RtcB
MNRVSGKTLKAWGFEPGDWFKANDMRQAGAKDREIIDALREIEDVSVPVKAGPDPDLVPVRRDDLVVFNPPITVYGEHDTKTVDQLVRCMNIGSAVKGVLCADGHLGYGHPIGGVIASRI